MGQDGDVTARDVTRNAVTAGNDVKFVARIGERPAIAFQICSGLLVIGRRLLIILVEISIERRVNLYEQILDVSRVAS